MHGRRRPEMMARQERASAPVSRGACVLLNMSIQKRDCETDPMSMSVKLIKVGGGQIIDWHIIIGEDHRRKLIQVVL
jgi:hypothetical protein